MPPLKVIEQPEFGGVDARSNPMAMPSNRLLMCRNWVPQPDGHLALRRGYTYAVSSAKFPGAIQSMVSFRRLTDGKNCVLFWVADPNFEPPHTQSPVVLDLETETYGAPPIRGVPIASMAYFQYALGHRGFLYMHNGTDSKFFDGETFRDIGLPTLTTAQLAGIQVTEGTAAFSEADATAVTMSLTPYTGAWNGMFPYYVYMSFFDTATNLLMNSPHPLSGTTTPFSWVAANILEIANIKWSDYPTNPTTMIGLLSIKASGAAGAKFGVGWRLPPATAATAGANVTVTCSAAHGLAVGDVIVWELFSPMTVDPGPFAVTAVLDATQFQFHPANSASFNGLSAAGIPVLLKVANGATTTSIGNQTSVVINQGIYVNTGGTAALAYADSTATMGLPASTVGGAQPGYQFYASIYNLVGGQHVGNRVAIGARLNNTSQCLVHITGLPDLRTGIYPAGLPKTDAGTHWGNGPKIRYGPQPAHDFVGDTEWVLLIGRTGDGGEVPYAIIDAGGNWVTVPSGQTSIIINESQIDGNSELPTANYPPPAFACFWREGDRQCGSVSGQPWVYRSATEADDTTGIFVGDPAQAWDPSMIETFPTAEPVIGGFGFMQESWVFTRNDMGQLSELSGEVAWNGPYNVGIAGPLAFDSGWNGLPFWLSHDKQLFTMMPNGNGPEPVSEEYEAALLSEIDDTKLAETAVNYYRDPEQKVEVLRIKCMGGGPDYGPYTVIHDFRLREPPNSPFGQGYQEHFGGILSADYYQQVVRDVNGHTRFWCGAADGDLYQLYTGANDNGIEFLADAVGLWYLGAYNTELRTVEFYGDALVNWFITPHTDTPFDWQRWVNLKFMSRPVPGQERNSHYMMDVVNPEMTHCLLWAQLWSHSQDVPVGTDPMALNSPPHIPLETYGRLYMVNPVLAQSRGR